MEQFIMFNGVKILLTTGERLSEIQNEMDREPDFILSVYPDRVKILRPTWIRTK